LGVVLLVLLSNKFGLSMSGNGGVMAAV